MVHGSVQENGQVGETEEAAEQKWHINHASSKILIEVATAYAITKVFLPARILLSVWATPWFARVVIGRVGGGIGRWTWKGKTVGKISGKRT